MPGLTPEPHFSSMGKGTRRGKRGGHGEEASAGVHGPCGLLALEVAPDSAALEGTSSFPPPWVLWAFIWSVSSQGSHKARLNSQYNSDK